MRPWKCSATPPFDGKHWHALYYTAEGVWREVRDDAGNCVVYASSKDALTAARELALTISVS